MNLYITKNNNVVLNPDIYHYSMLFFSFFLCISHAAISLSALWFLFLFVVGRNYVVSLKVLWNQPVIKWMTIFIIYVSLSVLWSQDIKTALNIIRLYGYWVIIPILVININKDKLHIYINAFLIGMLISEILSFGMYLGLWVIKGHGVDYPIPFMMHIHYSVFLAVTAVILVTRIFSSQYSRLYRMLMLTYLLMTLGDFLISIGRTGLVAFMLTMLLAVVLRYRIKPFIILLSIVIMAAATFGAYKLVNDFKIRVDNIESDLIKLSNHDYDSSLGIRSAFWIITYDVIKEHPVFGVGAGDYRKIAKEMITQHNYGFNDNVVQWCTNSHYHNQYLMVLVQGGLVGFVLMLLLITSLYRLKMDNRNLKELSVLMLSTYMVSCMAEPLWFLQFPIALFIFIAVISLTASMPAD